VEVNCETDFVSKNEKFQTLVAQITENCFKKSLATVSALDTTQVRFVLRKNFKHSVKIKLFSYRNQV
jgi:translation elongation factor EF-Ts